MSESDSVRVCYPPPKPINSRGQSATADAVLAESKVLWTIGMTLKYHFLDGTPNKKAAVTNTIKTWQTFANITFQETDDRDSADIRISFSRSGFWSQIGTRAKNVTDKSEPTMNFGMLEDFDPPTEDDAGTILHEFGHALGMLHEHQSPARGGTITLNVLETLRFFRDKHSMNNEDIQQQIIQPFNVSEVANLSQLDLDSIMIYSLPWYLTQEGISVHANTSLSETDKAFITLNYPRKKEKEGGMSVMRALEVTNVPHDVAAVILKLIDEEQYQRARETFSDFNIKVMNLSSANSSLLRSIDFAGHDIRPRMMDAVSQAVRDPLFKAVVRNIVQQVYTQRAIPTVNLIPGSDPRTTRENIGGMAISPAFAGIIHDINTELSGLDSGQRAW